MYVVTVPNRNSPPAILIRESYREEGKVKNRTVANISHWPTVQIEALRSVLKGDLFGVVPDLPNVNYKCARRQLLLSMFRAAA